jgi:hypothetical protein
MRCRHGSLCFKLKARLQGDQTGVVECLDPMAKGGERKRQDRAGSETIGWYLSEILEMKTRTPTEQEAARRKREP